MNYSAGCFKKMVLVHGIRKIRVFPTAVLYFIFENRLAA
jgi:hypothetical protein